MDFKINESKINPGVCETLITDYPMKSPFKIKVTAGALQGKLNRLEQEIKDLSDDAMIAEDTGNKAKYSRCYNKALAKMKESTDTQKQLDDLNSL